MMAVCNLNGPEVGWSYRVTDAAANGGQASSYVHSVPWGLKPGYVIALRAPERGRCVAKYAKGYEVIDQVNKQPSYYTEGYADLP